MSMILHDDIARAVREFNDGALEEPTLPWLRERVGLEYIRDIHHDNDHPFGPVAFLICAWILETAPIFVSPNKISRTEIMKRRADLETRHPEYNFPQSEPEWAWYFNNLVETTPGYGDADCRRGCSRMCDRNRTCMNWHAYSRGHMHDTIGAWYRYDWLSAEPYARW